MAGFMVEHLGTASPFLLTSGIAPAEVKHLAWMPHKP